MRGGCEFVVQVAVSTSAKKGLEPHFAFPQQPGLVGGWVHAGLIAVGRGSNYGAGK